MRTSPLTEVIRILLTLCVGSLHVAVLSAQCTNPTLVPPGTYTSGDHSQVDNNALSAANFAVSGGATATFIAGNCIHLRPGFRATAGTPGTTFHAWVDIAPSAVIFSPSGESGLSQLFTFMVSSPSGASNLSHVFALFNTSSNSTVSACYIHYDSTSNLLYLATNASDNWLGGFAPGSAGGASNSQCSILGSGASVSTSGTQLTVRVPVTFQPSFAGIKNEYLFALDGAGINTAWQLMGTWTVPATGTPAVTCSASPNPSYVGQTVTFAASATGGSPPYTYTWSGAVAGSGTAVSFQPGLSQNYSETVTVRDSLGIQASGACSATVRQLQTISELHTCISGAPAGGECALAPNTYTLNAPIDINRSNIIVRGGSSGMNDTKLVRDPSYTGDLIRIGPGVSVTGVAMKYLTVCGASNITPGWGPAPPSPIGCPRMLTVCGERTIFATRNPSVPNQPPQCVDISVIRSALPVFPLDPFTSPPASYAVEFDHVDLEDATGHALSLYGYNGIHVDDIYFHHGTINYSGVTGILMGVGGVDYSRKFCDGYADPGFGFANDRNVFAPRNIRIEHSVFTENRTGVTGGVGRWIAYRNNTFTRNYIWPQAQGGAVPGTNPPVGDPNQSWGGTLEFDACADQVQVTNNTFTGPGSAHPNTQALELYARNITVDTNSVSGYQLQGIVANSLNQASIRNNTISFAAPTDPADGGITIATVGAGGACTGAPLNIYRESKNISITGNSIWGQHYGVNLAEHPFRSTGAIHNLTIGTNYGNWTTAQYWQNAFVWASGYSGPSMTPGFQLLSLGVTPRVLPVDAESGFARALCALPGSARGLFTFAASDDSNGSANLPGYSPRIDYGAPGYAGAAQILYLEGIFSNTGPPTGPSNTAQDCHFYYAADANIVYLDDGTGTWGAGSSPVGPGGHDLTNPNGCTIHAASSIASVIQPGQYARSVTLDVEFLGPSAKKHIYAYTMNKNGTTSYAPADGLSQLIWQYWGWWQKP
jgi:hypothetical protein